MKYVLSRDGTGLGYERSGSGPPLLIVGGALADHQFYAPLASALQADFTVVNFDRRGRGASGNTQPYEIAREIEDVAALIALEARPVFVYGHSAGAALALRAAAAGIPMAQLVLADAPFSARGAQDEEARSAFAAERAQIEMMHARGDFRGSARFFLASLGVPADEVDGILESPLGGSMLDCARALLHDYLLLGDGLVPGGYPARVQVRTTVIATDAGETAAAQLVAAISDARMLRVENAAHETAPDDMAAALRGVLLGL